MGFVLDELEFAGEADGRQILRYGGTLTAAELDLLVPLYEVVPGERSVHLISRAEGRARCGAPDPAARPAGRPGRV